MWRMIRTRSSTLEMQTSDGRKPAEDGCVITRAMIDLNILDKGQDYTTLKKSYVIFICTFDPFGEGRHIYTFCNTCQENTALTLDDDAVKIILSTKGTNGRCESRNATDFRLY